MNRKALVLVILLPITSNAETFAERYGLPGQPAAPKKEGVPLRQTAKPASASSTAYPYHPYRKAGDRYYSLQPLYSWLAHANGENPMPAWFISGYGADIDVIRVFQVCEDGLLLSEERKAWLSEIRSFAPTRRSFLFLKNYPLASHVTDGQEIKFIAMPAGTYQYNDSQGARRTVPLYDYGVPYDPQQLAAEHARTNCVSTNSAAASIR